jgi:dTDP-4-amino-4,6-dideoxygalactose transaminase
MNELHTQQVTQVPLLDVNRGNQLDAQAIQDAIKGVTDSGRFLFGPDCQKLEESIAELCYVEHSVGCASGSDALLLALMALEIGSGDEVVVPSFTFFATASAVTRLGARPVFVDIDCQTFNMDAACLREVITPATKAVIPVHLFGQCAEMEEICAIAAEHDLHVIEDAAQAIGARYHGRPVGSWGDVGCFSFYPTKNLGGFGDGGMLVTRYSSLADKLRLLACHGMRPRYYHSVVGINSRLDSMQAAVLRVKLERLAEATIKRQANAQRYRELF